jgi:hypothetical protein
MVYIELKWVFPIYIKRTRGTTLSRDPSSFPCCALLYFTHLSVLSSPLCFHHRCPAAPASLHNSPPTAILSTPPSSNHRATGDRYAMTPPPPTLPTTVSHYLGGRRPRLSALPPPFRLLPPPCHNRRLPNPLPQLSVSRSPNPETLTLPSSLSPTPAIG